MDLFTSVKKKCWVTDNAMKAVAKENSDARFFYYLLKNYNLGRLKGGSGQPLLNQSIINSIRPFFPEVLFNFIFLVLSSPTFQPIRS